MIFDLFIKPAYASCPVCIVTVGGGLILAKQLGIDDLLVSIWIGGLNTLIAFWFATKIKNKLFNNPYLLATIFNLLTLIYLFYSKQLFHAINSIFGYDKVIVGIIFGFITVIFAEIIDLMIRKYNNGKVIYYHQKVIIPVFLLLFTTLIFKLLLK